MIETPLHLRDTRRELWILGSVLVDQGHFATIVERGIAEDDFSVYAYKSIFRAMKSLDEHRQPIDADALIEMLKGDQAIEEAGGAAFIAKIGDGIAKMSPVDAWCRAHIDQRNQRSLLALGENIATQACENGPAREVVTRLIETASDRIAQIRDASSEGPGLQHVKDLLHDFRPELEFLGTNKGQMLGRSTGFRELDRLTAGFCAGDYWIIAGRPGGCKTSLALELALRQVRQGAATVIYSFEMTRESVLRRLLSRVAGVPHHVFKHGNATLGQWRKIAEAIATLAELPIWIDTRPIRSESELGWRIRTAARRIDAKLIVVDYLQLMKSKKADSRYEAITNLSIELAEASKEIARISGGAILALSQLNRLAADEEPQLHHLRESGQLEQDGDVIAFVVDDRSAWTSSWKATDSDPKPKILDVKKQRDGAIGKIQLEFLPLVMGFDEGENAHRGANA